MSCAGRPAYKPQTQALAAQKVLEEAEAALANAKDSDATLKLTAAYEKARLQDCQTQRSCDYVELIRTYLAEVLDEVSICWIIS